MDKEIGNRIARFFYLNLKKWDEIRFEGVFLLRERDTGKSFSEAFILASTNPQYDDRLFIEL